MGKIIIIGLGPGSPDELSLGALRLLQSGRAVYLRTAVHPVVAYLVEQGVSYRSFDHLYDTAATFEAVYISIAAELVERAVAGEEIVYAVPGHPAVAEQSVRETCAQAAAAGVAVEVRPGVSFLDTLFCRLPFDPADGLKVIDALQTDRQRPDPAVANIIAQVHNQLVASEVKLQLMETYPDEYPIRVIRAGGVSGEEQIVTIPLYELDRLPWLDHLTSVFVPAAAPGDAVLNRTIEALTGIMERLRAPEGCPWDREQTHATLKPYLIEEAYEVAEAVDSGDLEHLCDELGDVLLQVAFHAQIARESGGFAFGDVIAGIVEKMIRRHPHVFATTQVANSAEVLTNWDKIKAGENGARRTSVLDGVPAHFPALMKANKLQAKAAKVGFDWDSIDGALAKLQEETAELLEALAQADQAKVAEELGDLLFAAVNVARFAGVEPETALLRTAAKFTERFRHIEVSAAAAGKVLSRMTLPEMDALWDEAKAIAREKKGGNDGASG